VRQGAAHTSRLAKWRTTVPKGRSLHTGASNMPDTLDRPRSGSGASTRSGRSMLTPVRSPSLAFIATHAGKVRQHPLFHSVWRRPPMGRPHPHQHDAPNVALTHTNMAPSPTPTWPSPTPTWRRPHPHQHGVALTHTNMTLCLASPSPTPTWRTQKIITPQAARASPVPLPSLTRVCFRPIVSVLTLDLYWRV
jgi:hypothetical protein